MKTQYSIRLIILLIILGIFILGIVFFGSFLIYRTTLASFDIKSILSGILFLWLGLGYLTLIIGKIKTLELRQGILIIKKPLLNKSIAVELSKIKYLEFEWHLTWNTLKGILIQLDNGDIEQISVKEYRNSKKIIELITNSCKRDQTIRQKIWTKELKIFTFIGIFILFVGILLVMITSIK